jgi:hypothetical protein
MLRKQSLCLTIVWQALQQRLDVVEALRRSVQRFDQELE